MRVFCSEFPDFLLDVRKTFRVLQFWQELFVLLFAERLIEEVIFFIPEADAPETIFAISAVKTALRFAHLMTILTKFGVIGFTAIDILIIQFGLAAERAIKSIFGMVHPVCVLAIFHKS